MTSVIVSHPIHLSRLVLALALLPLWLATPASAFQLGIEDDGVLLWHYRSDPATVYDHGDQLGASVVRMVVGPPPGGDWSATDDAVDTARAHGYRVYLTLAGPAKPRVGPFVRFVGEAAAHFRGRVDDFSLYNEPDYMAVPPALYRRLFAKGRRAVQQANPAARVYVGELSGIRPIEYMREVLKAGPLEAEGFAWHPYQFTRAPESNRGRHGSVGIGRIERLRKFLRQSAPVLSTPRRQPLGMYITEFGYMTRGHLAVSDRTAAAWWPRVIALARRSRVRLLIAYQMVCNTTPDRPWDSSLIGADGKPRDAFWAIRAARTTKRRSEAASQRFSSPRAGLGSPPTALW